MVALIGEAYHAELLGWLHGALESGLQAAIEVLSCMEDTNSEQCMCLYDQTCDSYSLQKITSPCDSVLMPSGSPPPPTGNDCAPLQPYSGDNNGDLEVDILDVLETISHIQGVDVFTDCEFLASDVNIDGEINVTDTVLL